MLKLIRKYNAYKMGRKLGAIIGAEIDGFIADQFNPAQERFLDVFKQLIEKDSLENNSAELLQVEWKIFDENLFKFISEMKARANVSLYKFDETIQSIGIQGEIDNLINIQFKSLEEETRLLAARELSNKINEIRKGN